jgi:hypothetical protein
MDIRNYIIRDTLRLRVIPNAKRAELKEENNQLKLYLKSVPEKGKANQELIRFFKKQFHLTVEILAGENSREKLIRIVR